MKKLLLILTLINSAVHAMQSNGRGLTGILNPTPHDQRQENAYRYCEKNLRIKTDETGKQQPQIQDAVKEEHATISEHVFHFPGFVPANQKEKSAYVDHLNKQKDIVGGKALEQIVDNCKTAAVALGCCLLIKGDQYLADTYLKFAEPDESIYQYFSRVGF